MDSYIYLCLSEVACLERTNCMCCGGSRLVLFIDMGPQPNGNTFLEPEHVGDEILFDLSMLVCQDCWLVQLKEMPSPEFLFSSHPYVTGLNKPVVEHFQNLAPHIVSKLNLKKQDLVIDIGCNDGTFLQAFASEGMRVLGVDPGNKTGDLAEADGVTVLRQFWCHSTGTSLRQLNVKPKLITATAVFYHVPDLHDFCRGLVEVMSSETVFVAQCVNLRDLMEGFQFDHFYHEHSCIYSFSPLVQLLAMHGLRIQDVEMSPIHGGSFVAYIVRNEHSLPSTGAVQEALDADSKAGLSSIDTFDTFEKEIAKNKDDLKRLLEQLKEEGKTVYCLGAPVKGSTLLNTFGIDSTLVEAATEVNQFKIGKVMPGVHIPIVDEDALEKPPDFYLVLAWNYADFLREKFHDYLAAGGRFIVPCPHVEILGPLTTPRVVKPTEPTNLCRVMVTGASGVVGSALQGELAVVEQ